VNYFHYAGRQENGLSIQGWLLAESRDDAVSTLCRRQIQPLYVKKGPGQIPLKVPVEELLATLRELGSLRGSGMPLDQAVVVVAETAEHRELRSAWVKVGQAIRSGLSLSEAFASVPQAFPRYAVPMVRLGEANGDLHSVLQAVADRLEEEVNLRNEVRSALTYPLFLMVISVAVLLFLFLMVIPKFGTMVGDMGGGASGSLSVLLAVANFLQEYFWLWGGGILLLVLMLIHYAQSGMLQTYVWRLLQAIPGMKGLLQAWEVVQFCSSMRRLLPQGVSILEALQLSSETLGREEMRYRLQLAAGGVRQGESLADSLRQQEVFPPLVLQMIEVGETSASLPDSMKEIGKLYERRLREGIRRFLSLLEPAVIVTLGLLVGGIMVSLLSGIMSMNDLPI